ncbi:MAG TPA: hypothetical protein VGK10_19495 [Prolixibacteraceae bacterium]|jgi:hypothetical protein
MKTFNIKEKDQLLKIIVAIIVFLNMFLIFSGIIIKNYYKDEIKRYKIKIDDYNKLFTQDLQLLSQDISVNYDSININTPKDSLVLIYTYSGGECNKCILEDIYALKKKFKKNNENDVIVLPVMENTKNVNISLNADLVGINYKRLNRELVKFPYLNGNQRRFFAILTRNGKILLPFFPEVSAPDRTIAYLDFVFAKYFNDNHDTIRVAK